MSLSTYVLNSWNLALTYCIYIALVSKKFDSLTRKKGNINF